MNVTNIGFPFAAPAPQGGSADTGAGSGFAGVLGTIAAGDGQDQMQIGAATGAAQIGTPMLTTETNAPLLPPAFDAAAQAGAAVPGGKPQVAMAQLLATAAPAAVTPPVAAGGNPLADAVAKALAKAGAADAAATPAAPEASTAGTTPITGAENGLAAPTAQAVPATSPTPAPGVEPAIATPSPTFTAKPNAATPVGTPAPGMAGADPATAAALPVVTAGAPSEAPVQPGKTGARPNRAAGEKAVPDAAGTPIAADSAAVALAAAIAAPQPVPVAQPVPVTQPIAQAATPEAPSGATSSRIAKAQAGAPLPAGTAAPSGIDAQAGEVRLAAGAKSEGGETGKGGGNEAGQQSFGQQLAAADAGRIGTAPAPQGAPMVHAAASTNAAAPVAAQPAAPAAEPVLQARPGELGRSLGVEIARKVDAGEDMLRVRLNPAELGRVEVTLAFDDKGHVQATMRAESQHTLNLLRQEAPDLGRALDQAGIRTDAGSFRFESRDGGNGSGGTGSQSAFQQQSRGGSQQFRDEPESQPVAYRPIRGDGQVDLIA